MKVSTIAIDLAKNVFQVLGMDKHAKQVFSKRLNRAQLSEFMSQQPVCDVVFEACYSSHYWGRKFLAKGHSVKLIPAQHVTPFVRGSKNDKNDTMAIYEASFKPNLRFVPVKTEAQHGAQRPIIKLMPNDFWDKYQTVSTRLDRINHLIKQLVERDPNGRILLSIPGVGPIITSAFIASIGAGQAFNSPKELAVWLGLTTKQFASGNKSVNGGITKRGDGYLRKQLIHGARTVLSHASRFKSVDNSIKEP